MYGVPDHVHVLVEIDPQYGITKLVHPGRNNPPVGSGGALGALGALGTLGTLGASFYFNPIEVVENFCRVALVRIMKGRSSRYLRQEFAWVKSRIPTLWTNSYFFATVGGAPLKAVKEYIQNQKNV